MHVMLSIFAIKGDGLTPDWSSHWPYKESIYLASFHLETDSLHVWRPAFSLGSSGMNLQKKQNSQKI
jgi:hypothetical protein